MQHRIEKIMKRRALINSDMYFWQILVRFLFSQEKKKNKTASIIFVM